MIQPLTLLCLLLLDWAGDEFLPLLLAFHILMHLLLLLNNLAGDEPYTHSHLASQLCHWRLKEEAGQRGVQASSQVLAQGGFINGNYLKRKLMRRVLGQFKGSESSEVKKKGED